MNQFHDIVRTIFTKSMDAEFQEPKRIAAVGIGNAGCSIINSLNYKGIRSLETIAIETDRKYLDTIRADKRVLIGKSLIKYLGSGGYPDVGKRAAEMARPTLESILESFDLVFVTAGLGGGTGTGAAPVIAEIAKDNGAIVVGMVTYPFPAEQARLHNADEGLEPFRHVVDSLIIFDNNRMNPPGLQCCFIDAFSISRHAIIETIQCISQMICRPALVDIDFADIRAIMCKQGDSVLMYGQRKLLDPPGDLIKSCLDHQVDIIDHHTARGCIVLFTGGTDMNLKRVEEIAHLFSYEIQPHADVIWGARINPVYEGSIRVIAIMTGIGY
jgi:cell division protein FtsZ